MLDVLLTHPFLGSCLECSAGVSTPADENSEVSQPCGSHGKCPAIAPWKFFPPPCGVSPYTCAALYSVRELRNCLCKFLESSSFLSGTLSCRPQPPTPHCPSLWSVIPVSQHKYHALLGFPLPVPWARMCLQTERWGNCRLYLICCDPFSRITVLCYV